MRTLQVGDQVRIDIPNKSDPDHDRLHRKHGTIVDKIEDDAGQETGDPRDSVLYAVELENSIEHLRWRDLRPL